MCILTPRAAERRPDLCDGPGSTVAAIEPLPAVVEVSAKAATPAGATVTVERAGSTGGAEKRTGASAKTAAPWRSVTT